MNSDFKELLQALHDHTVEYLIIGGYAVIYHSEPRFTKDLDLWINPNVENAGRLMAAFQDFGMPLIDIEESDFTTPGTQYVMGMPPCAIDFLTSVEPLDFDLCWQNRDVSDIEGVEVNYLGKQDLIKAKEFANRDQDRLDLKKLSGEE